MHNGKDEATGKQLVVCAAEPHADQYKVVSGHRGRTQTLNVSSVWWFGDPTDCGSTPMHTFHSSASVCAYPGISSPHANGNLFWREICNEEELPYLKRGSHFVYQVLEHSLFCLFLSAPCPVVPLHHKVICSWGGVETGRERREISSSFSCSFS